MIDNKFVDAARSRVLVLDGAMGTMIQRLNLSEDDFRGVRFANHPSRLRGCNDLLCISRPDDIADIHRQYIDAGADIIETNTFNANAISLADYGLQDLAYEIALAGARLARSAAGTSHFVAGSMGPTNVSLSLANSEFSFDDLVDAYSTQARGLIDGGVDLLLLETVFDTLNAKAAILGIDRARAATGANVPLMISATLTENGRLLSGQSLCAFLISIAHANPISVGLNCGFGAEGMIPYLREIADVPYLVSVHPNAGLPDELGRYVESPESMAATIASILKESLVNIIGGCCGTTPAHIRLIAQAARMAAPRSVPAYPQNPLLAALSGLEPIVPADFIRVGERCNVAGSRNFLKMIAEGDIARAVDTAAAQIAAGATVLDINMDDGLLNAPAEMTRFVSALALDPRTAPVPLMIDSSDFNVILAALKIIQGRSIVNSISLKEGEEAFLLKAKQIRSLGAAVVVMAFDEDGQADTFERRIDICRRSYRLLTLRAGFQGCEIVFDPNVLAVATGIDAHADYALSFLQATEWISANLPGARVSGGISNLSFAFRGNNPLRRAMHAQFISMARPRGLSMAIMNPSAPIEPTPDMPDELLDAIRDVLLNSRPDAADRLLDLAANMLPTPTPKAPKAQTQAPRQESVADLIVAGREDGLIPLLQKELSRASAVDIINSTLMSAMDSVGNLFAEGKLFLPQVVRAAAIMKKAVEFLSPFIEKEADTNAPAARPVMVLATVKGDVHDIGKNIVAIVMRCSGFNVIDLGVMVPAEQIVDAAIAHNADIIGLSGLITPSLAEMANVAAALEAKGLKIPLFVGGATTSPMHTAVKIAPLYSAPVVHTADAASLPPLARKIALPEVRMVLAVEQTKLRRQFQQKQAELPIDEARVFAQPVDSPAPAPKFVGRLDLFPDAESLLPLVNWRAFLGEWSLDPNGNDNQARELIEKAKDRAAKLPIDVRIRLDVRQARRVEPEIVQVTGLRISLPRLCIPNPVTGVCPSLADFVATFDDHIGFFATAVHIPESDDPFEQLLRQTLAHRLAEAATVWLHHFASDGKGIRPAVGYSSLPNHSIIFKLNKILQLADLGISLSEAGAMSPGSSTCGLLIFHPSARYF